MMPCRAWLGGAAGVRNVLLDLVVVTILAILTVVITVIMSRLHRYLWQTAADAREQQRVSSKQRAVSTATLRHHPHRGHHHPRHLWQTAADKGNSSRCSAETPL
jgi:hypothetical protein